MDDLCETLSFALPFKNDSAIRSLLLSERNVPRVEFVAVWQQTFREYL